MCVCVCVILREGQKSSCLVRRAASSLLTPPPVWVVATPVHAYRFGVHIYFIFHSGDFSYVVGIQMITLKGRHKF